LAVLAGATLLVPTVQALAPDPNAPIQDVSIKAEVVQSLSLSLDTTEVDLGTVSPSSLGTSLTTPGFLSATVNTNNDNGWTFSIKDSDDDTGLNEVSGPNKFDALSGQKTSLGTGDVWAYRVESIDSVPAWSTGQYSGISDSDQILVNEGSAAPTGVTIVLSFIAQLAQDSVLSPGEYSDVITLTAVALGPPAT
jgi:hypothetical protein